MGNRIKTTLLLTGLTAFLLFVGNLLGGRTGMVIALVFAGAMNFFSYWYSDKIVLKMYRAREATPEQAPRLHRLVENLARRAGIPKPGVYILPEAAPNAFATGRNPEHAVVAVTQGLLDLMDDEEVEGVLAHELAHVANRDILISSIAATLAGAVMMLATMARWSAIFGGFRSGDDEGGGNIIGLLAMSILAPIAAVLIQAAVSRSREFDADATGAKIAGSPRGLARALEKLGAYSGRAPLRASTEAAQATAHLFIVNPLSGRSMANLFSTHPPIEERVARLTGRRPGGVAGPSDFPDQARRPGEDFWRNLD
ncbi:MAG: zinc metalloprotease HtpX [Deltaproteobacteria bacterium]|nr:zinc metalloprotease HtpX [Deltaproteobacteria bacterium]